jgi:hypothetical protein
MSSTPKNAKIYNCEKCDFSCCKKSEWDRHINTLKHKNRINTNLSEQKKRQYICDCGKKYKHLSSLCNHKKICVYEKQEDNNLTDIVNPEFIITLLKQNNELQQQLLELCKNGITNNSVNQVNSHNKTFNLNVFLNEQCKDAMNIMDFVDSIKLDLSDLESVGKLGYINGISNIIIKNLKALDVHMRPIHCTDLKRETMYVKSQNIWEKEDEENKNIRRAIKHVAFKNIKNLELFQ